MLDFITQSSKIELSCNKTKDFTTLSLSKRTYMANDNSPQINECSLDKNGQSKHKEKMDALDSEIYDQLKDKIASGMKKLNEMYFEEKFVETKAFYLPAR